MRQDRRQEQARLVSSLKARVGTLDVDQMIQLLTSLKEDAKDTLLTCTPEEFARVQSEGVTYERLIRMLTRADIKTMQASGSE